MPITKITIENFKGIRERVEIPLRPITLLFGANSAGKSTLLQALLYFRELLERQNADADQLLASGEMIDLGGFRQLVHGHNLTRKVRIGVEITIDDDGLPTIPTADYRPSHPWDVQSPKDDELVLLGIEGVTGVALAYVEVTVEWYASHQKPYITEYRVELNGEPAATIKSIPGFPAHLGGINISHSLFPSQFEDEAPDLFPENNLISQQLSTAITGTEFIGPSGFSDGNFPLEGGVIPGPRQPLNFSYDRNSDDGREAAGLGFPFVEYLYSQLMVSPGELVLNELKRIRYIGPIRSIPKRQFNESRSPKDDAWSDGRAAWALLASKARAGDSYDMEFIEEVSRCLAGENRLNLGYQLIAQASYQLPADSILLASLELAKSRLSRAGEDEDADEMLTPILDGIRGLQQSVQLKLVDGTNNTEVDPCDVGVGVSQVVPIIVGALAPGAGVMAVEQPELHLHPAIQCSLADVFVKEVHENDDRIFLLETHSEHLLLRLMKRIRQTSAGDLAEGARSLTPDLISVLYVEPYEGRSVFREMPINSQGELIKAWPGGFFEEDLDELL
ncbi:MAG: AAA family ATPase [Verrucomicrobiae bacterium]|nr:AAA family ATPase [Verrucomicrobiae bacterium]